MLEIQSIFSILFVTTGIIFMLMGSIGILRLPDFYSRTHAVSKSDTLGVFFVIIGLIIYEGFTLSSGKLFLIVLFIALSNPIGTHALARAALKKGIRPLLHDDKKGGPSS
ncbi:monovalent cation/H(+) antiporter subunit G [Rhodohalobacter barkolensis]|uniref:Cation:proton antiporter n=1 Tax=Rhodohalobacter barkolensis TaxID=2053187 RepID=A0A2N0VLQ4_9BACT|nr:monovalent cation/H(+) antiporter subunit G [Rhodohalobacter barkolensis]PKD45133.1 cation:proton antiporter [Rhodohalobacter barkolensis]